MELTIGWIMLVAAGWCAVAARRLDAELDRLMPPRIDLRDRVPPRWDLEEPLLERWGNELESVGEGLIPDRWETRFQSAAGAPLVGRFWLLVASSFVLGAIGLGVVAIGSA